MALPTAPLGQLPSLNLPYSVPTHEVGPSIWEKALAAFLVNAAGNVATQGAQNVMSRDYATEFGEKPATFMQRLGGGPVVSEEDAIRRRAATSAKEAQLRDIAAGGNIERFRAKQAMERQATDIEKAIAQEELANQRMLQELDIRSDIADRNALREAPSRKAQAARDEAGARLANAQAIGQEAFNKRFSGFGTAGTASTPSPVASEKERAARAAARQTAQKPGVVLDPAVEARINARLAKQPTTAGPDIQAMIDAGIPIEDIIRAIGPKSQAPIDVGAAMPSTPRNVTPTDRVMETYNMQQLMKLLSRRQDLGQF